MILKEIIKLLAVPFGKSRFVLLMKIIKNKGTLLDIGCGNNSPYRVKKILPKAHYIGIDIGDYNQTTPNLADEYILTSADTFSDAITGAGAADIIISSHNLEHCNNREKTLAAILKVLKPGGWLYLSFPTEKSVGFDHRAGTLNYYDDPTHLAAPPKYDEIIRELRHDGIKIVFAKKSYKPFLWFMLGFINEAKSKRKKEIMEGTWAYWGFETVIWGRK